MPRRYRSRSKRKTRRTKRKTKRKTKRLIGGVRRQRPGVWRQIVDTSSNRNPVYKGKGNRILYFYMGHQHGWIVSKKKPEFPNKIIPHELHRPGVDGLQRYVSMTRYIPEEIFKSEWSRTTRKSQRLRASRVAAALARRAEIAHPQPPPGLPPPMILGQPPAPLPPPAPPPPPPPPPAPDPDPDVVFVGELTLDQRLALARDAAIAEGRMEDLTGDD